MVKHYRIINMSTEQVIRTLWYVSFVKKRSQRFPGQRHLLPAVLTGTMTHYFARCSGHRKRTAPGLVPNPRRRAVEVLRLIALDSEFDPATRFGAAQRLSEVDERRAGEVFRRIALDSEFDPGTRDEAAHRLAEIDPSWAAEAAWVQ